jgi:hypothetical protein
VPRPDPRSRRGQVEETKPRRSRIDELKRRKIEPALPPNPAPHITDRLIEIGLTEAAGMGVVPISWREIDAWQRQTCVAIEPWEKRLLRRLSAAYLAENRKAEIEHAPPPWRAQVTAHEREIAEAELRSVLG